MSSSIAPWDRPAFAEALEWGPDAVAVQDFDRLIRSELRWGPDALEIPCPALIAEDEYNALQVALSGTRRKSYRAQRTYPLSGRLHGPHRRYVGSAHKGKPAYIVVGMSWNTSPPLDAKEIETRV